MSFTCPRCRMTSYNPNDEREGYCGNCHAFTGLIEGEIMENNSMQPSENKMLSPGWNDVTNITTVKIYMKDGQEYSLTVDDPRINIDDYLVPGRTVKTKEGAVINTSEIQRYNKFTTTTVIPNTIEGIEHK